MQLVSKQGEGTTVIMYLPRSEEEKHQHTESIAELGVLKGEETILIVDDNPDVRSTAAALVRNLGYRVLEAPNGPAALETLNIEQVDMLISDVMMAHMTGFDLADRVRQHYPDTQA